MIFAFLVGGSAIASCWRFGRGFALVVFAFGFEKREHRDDGEFEILVFCWCVCVCGKSGKSLGGRYSG